MAPNELRLSQVFINFYCTQVCWCILALQVIGYKLSGCKKVVNFIVIDVSSMKLKVRAIIRWYSFYRGFVKVIIDWVEIVDCIVCEYERWMLNMLHNFVYNFQLLLPMFIDYFEILVRICFTYNVDFCMLQIIFL